MSNHSISVAGTIRVISGPSESAAHDKDGLGIGAGRTDGSHTQKSMLYSGLPPGRDRPVGSMI